MRKMRAKNGAPGGNRTHDPLLRRQLLYPLSYQGTHAKTLQVSFNLAHDRAKIKPDFKNYGKIQSFLCRQRMKPRGADPRGASDQTNSYIITALPPSK